jgi:hypothetical protein
MGLIRRSTTAASPISILIAAMAIAACTRHGPAASGGASGSTGASAGVTVGPNHSFAKVVYRPEVKTIEASGFASTLTTATPDGLGLVFHNAPADIRALKAGDVLMIKSQLARKVVAAETDGEDTYVVTATAAITDLVADGEINVEAPLRFSKAQFRTSERPRQLWPNPLDLFVSKAYAQSPEATKQQQMEEEEYKKQLKDAVKDAILADWKIDQLQYSTGDGAFDFNLVLAKDFQGFVGKVGAKGHVNNFDFLSDINVKNGLVSSITAGLKNVSGQLNFNWEVAKESNGGWSQEDLVKLPGALNVDLSPFVEGIPLYLEVSSAMVIHPALTGGKQISVGGFTISMGGQMNAQITSQGAADEGSSMDQTIEITNDGGLTAVAPDAMVIAYAAPRIELGVSAFGTYKETLSKFATRLDQMQQGAAAIFGRLMPGVQTGLGTVKASNVLKSSADVYAQLISTEGAVHSPATAMIPCSRQWISFEGVVGTAADIAGITPTAKRSATVFQKRYDKAVPPSNFCEKVGT